VKMNISDDIVPHELAWAREDTHFKSHLQINEINESYVDA